MLTRRIAAPPESVLQAALRPIATGFADPVQPEAQERKVTWGSVPDIAISVTRTAEVTPDGDGSTLALRTSTEFRLPYFRWLIGLLVRRAVRSGAEHMADVIEARATGLPDPKRPRRPVWAPPDRLTPEQAASISTVCAILAVVTYGGSLFTQTSHYIASTFGATDSDLGIALAFTRAGTLIGLLGSILSDRRGRRLMLIVATVAVGISTVVSAVAPSLPIFTGLQIVNRGFVNLVAVVGFITVTEEASEGGRAYMLALASIASAAGFALGALLLPVADLAPEAWRWLYALSAVGLVMVPGLAKNLPETRRFAAMAGRAARARTAEIVDRLYGPRFVVVALTGLLLNFFAAPTSQFTNRYLADDHGYSGLDILLMRFFTQGPPALIAVWAGGRIAESSGRKPIAARASLLMAVTTAAFFLAGGPLLWLTLMISTVAGALSGPALAAFNTELFPTEVRGRAGGWLLVVAVVGSVLGILLTGFLAAPLGSVGNAAAITAAGPAIVGLALVRLLPEARGRKLDEVSPPEV
ncbi:MAG: MFS transporter [Actinomycetota bacterium]